MDTVMSDRKILITGNKDNGLALSLAKIWPSATFASRTTGYDLTSGQDQDKLVNISAEYDVFVNNSALCKFNQTLLLEKVYKKAKYDKHDLRIICVGSTTDRATGAKDWMYQQEKKALRNYCTGISMMSVWSGGPHVSLISFGTLSNNQHKHPDRRCMTMDAAADYIKWLIDIPPGLAINELSIDPIQVDNWHD